MVVSDGGSLRLTVVRCGVLCNPSEGFIVGLWYLHLDPSRRSVMFVHG